MGFHIVVQIGVVGGVAAVVDKRIVELHLSFIVLKGDTVVCFGFVTIGGDMLCSLGEGVLVPVAGNHTSFSLLVDRFSAHYQLVVTGDKAVHEECYSHIVEV